MKRLMNFTGDEDPCGRMRPVEKKQNELRRQPRNSKHALNWSNYIQSVGKMMGSL